MTACVVDVSLIDENDDSTVHMVRRASGVTMSVGAVNITWVGNASSLRAVTTLRRLLRELERTERGMAL